MVARTKIQAATWPITVYLSEREIPFFERRSKEFKSQSGYIRFLMWKDWCQHLNYTIDPTQLRRITYGD